MLKNLLKRLFGSSNDRTIASLKPIVQKINDLEPTMKAMSDADLQACTQDLKDRFQKGSSLDHLLPEAFAVVREASKRVLKMRPFDVQLMGGIILHRGRISEMMTGEGKTLVSTLPAYLNALTGRGVHIVTVNDYLARRDAESMGKLHGFLGLSVGCITSNMSDEDRKAAYACDITYGTNNEFGFDYLRDNMKFQKQDMCQRGFHYAIIDEVDSILIDEARTPLIISGSAEDSSELYTTIDAVMPDILPEHYEKEEKSRSVTLTEKGSTFIEERLLAMGLTQNKSLYDPQNILLLHHVNQALKAHVIFQKDVDYLVKDDKIILIDEFTGRMMDGRRYSEGLHQAIEAKEKVTIQMENQTLASITFQNYFRMYDKLSGMTGTALTEAEEFHHIYGLDVVSIPTNLPLCREDLDDEVYRTDEEKYKAIVKLIETCQKKGQPVLVGTTSIEKSEGVSRYLKKSRIKHQVLNARFHAQEADIITQAGVPGAVTVATNMAGRGTDIKLGGNAEVMVLQETADLEEGPVKEKKVQEIYQKVAQQEIKVKEAGGLYVIGTERHESRRIDNQLRGRSGRQGDPGASKFFLSLEDDLMRIFGSEKLDTMLKRLGLEEGEAITHKWVNKALERAQQKVEARNYDIRKHLLKYDDVMNDQRKVIFSRRHKIMESTTLHDDFISMSKSVVQNVCDEVCPEGTHRTQWDLDHLREECMRLFSVKDITDAWQGQETLTKHDIQSHLEKAVQEKLLEKKDAYGPETLNLIEKSILLRVLDQAWKDHLYALDQVRQGINLRAYAQKDPLNEYKHEAFSLFEGMLRRIHEMSISGLCHVQISSEESYEDDFEDVAPKGKGAGLFQETRSLKSRSKSPKKTKKQKKNTSQTFLSDDGDSEPISRNAPCPCGSGKRYKHCHGSLT